MRYNQINMGQTHTKFSRTDCNLRSTRAYMNHMHTCMRGSTYFPHERSAELRRLTRDVELLRLRVSSTSELRRLLCSDGRLPSLLERLCIRAKRPLPLRSDWFELTLARRDDVSDPVPDDRRDGCDAAENSASDRPEMRLPAMVTAAAVSGSASSPLLLPALARSSEVPGYRRVLFGRRADGGMLVPPLLLLAIS